MDMKELRLAPIFCDGMVLQRDQENIIYGTDQVADVVTMIFMEREYSATTDGEGRFSIRLPKVPGGGPYELTVKGSRLIIISDILFGDVYLLAGQSNMELPLRRVLDVSEEEIKRTNEPKIRQYLLPASYQYFGANEYMYSSPWKKAQGEDLLGFSAAGYFFAKEIKDTYQVSIGLILAAVGGSCIEAWMSKESNEKFSRIDKRVKDFYDINLFHEFMTSQQEISNKWLREIEEEEAKVSADDYKEWKTCMVPALVSDYSDQPFQGSVYLCKEINISDVPTDADANIYMGTIIDSDCIWINGKLIGRTEYRYPPRKYNIPKNVLKRGSNQILIRIVINRGNGGTIKGRPYYISYNNKQISLEGKWHYHIGKASKIPMPEMQFPTRFPTGLFHTAIVPLSQIGLKGILWYQGESNTLEPKEYGEKFKEMLQSWRDIFGKEIPCIYVQLPGYQEPLDNREDTGWAEIRQQQLQNLSMNQVAMVVTLDLGEYNDLHPQNKKGVGVRMANAAKHLIYAEDNFFSGPIPRKGYVSGHRVCLDFDYLEDSGEEEQLIHNFELAGTDHKFYAAYAVRKGATLMITCDNVSTPYYVRYAWRDNPENINFYNHAGLPAAGFCMELS